MDLEMGILKLKREMSPRCVASQTLETHKKQLRAVRHFRNLQREGCGWDHVKLLSACNWRQLCIADCPHSAHSETQSSFERGHASKAQLRGWAHCLLIKCAMLAGRAAGRGTRRFCCQTCPWTRRAGVRHMGAYIAHPAVGCLLSAINTCILTPRWRR